jgi:hypothetical protein
MTLWYFAWNNPYMGASDWANQYHGQTPKPHVLINSPYTGYSVPRHSCRVFCEINPALLRNIN